MERLKKAAANLEENVCVVIFLAMLFLMFYQVILRYVFRAANAWSEEAARYLHIWMIFISASLAAKKSNHVKIDSLMYIYPKAVRKHIEMVGEFLWLAFNITVIVVGSWYALSIHRSEQISYATRLRMSYVYAALPVGYTLMTIRMLQNKLKGRTTRSARGDTANE